MLLAALASVEPFAVFAEALATPFVSVAITVDNDMLFVEYGLFVSNTLKRVATSLVYD